MTSGVISALDRAVRGNGVEMAGLIQTDVAINPGSSGGPLADRSGNVIGITTAIVSFSGEHDGVGFAVPIADALKVAETVTRQPTALQTSSDGSPGGLMTLGWWPIGYTTAVAVGQPPGQQTVTLAGVEGIIVVSARIDENAGTVVDALAETAGAEALAIGESDAVLFGSSLVWVIDNDLLVEIIAPVSLRPFLIPIAEGIERVAR